MRAAETAISVDLLDQYRGGVAELLKRELDKLREQIPDSNVVVIRVEKLGWA